MELKTVFEDVKDGDHVDAQQPQLVWRHVALFCTWGYQDCPHNNTGVNADLKQV